MLSPDFTFFSFSVEGLMDVFGTATVFFTELALSSYMLAFDAVTPQQWHSPPCAALLHACF